jgi:hypothetical protein
MGLVNDTLLLNFQNSLKQYVFDVISEKGFKSYYYLGIARHDILEYVLEKRWALYVTLYA